MNYQWAKLYTNISTNLDNTNSFPFLEIFSHNFYHLTTKKQFLDLFSLAS